jgi:hypothetical protein
MTPRSQSRAFHAEDGGLEGMDLHRDGECEGL